MAGLVDAADLSKLSDRVLLTLAVRQIDDPSTFEKYQEKVQAQMNFYEELLKVTSEEDARSLIASARERWDDGVIHEEEVFDQWKQRRIPRGTNSFNHSTLQYYEMLHRAKTGEEFEKLLADIHHPQRFRVAKYFQESRRWHFLPVTEAGQEMRRREGVKKIKSDLYEWIGLVISEEMDLVQGRVMRVTKVAAKSPAEEAKFQKKDRLLSIEKQRLGGVNK